MESLIALITHNAAVGVMHRVVFVGAGAIIVRAIGAAFVVVGAIHDVVALPSAARVFNRTHHLDATLTLAPIRTTTATAPGLGARTARTRGGNEPSGRRASAEPRAGVYQSLIS